MQQEKRIKIKFDGEQHQISIQTFIGSLTSFSVVVKQVNESVNPGAQLEIKIKANERGSFTTDLLFIAQNSQHLFTRENANLLADLVIVTGGLYGFWQWLQGRKVEQANDKPGGIVEVTDNEGNITQINGDVYNIYANNEDAKDALSKNFASLEEDPSVAAYEISDSSGTLFRAEREDFGVLSTKSQSEEDDLKKSVVAANLIINKLVFDGRDRKWEFYYQGTQISAPIIDDQFFDAINAGEQFAKGDQLNVDLEISQVFEPSLNAFVIHSYKVLKVNEHIPRDQKTQTHLFSI